MTDQPETPVAAPLPGDVRQVDIDNAIDTIDDDLYADPTQEDIGEPDEDDGEEVDEDLTEEDAEDLEGLLADTPDDAGDEPIVEGELPEEEGD